MGRMNKNQKREGNEYQEKDESNDNTRKHVCCRFQQERDRLVHCTRQGIDLSLQALASQKVELVSRSITAYRTIFTSQEYFELTIRCPPPWQDSCSCISLAILGPELDIHVRSGTFF
jgi:hypothetical protein